jgi:hypothetical protein
MPIVRGGILSAPKTWSVYVGIQTAPEGLFREVAVLSGVTRKSAIAHVDRIVSAGSVWLDVPEGDGFHYFPAYVGLREDE